MCGFAVVCEYDCWIDVDAIVCLCVHFDLCVCFGVVSGFECVCDVGNNAGCGVGVLTLVWCWAWVCIVGVCVYVVVDVGVS